MSFATKQDLIDRFGELELIQLTDRVNRPSTTIDDTTVERALADADAIAISYLRKAYELPLPTTPPALTKTCADLARYYLFGDRAEKDSAVAINHKLAMAWLKDVAAGLVQLDLGGGSTGMSPAQAGGGIVKAKTADRVFTRDKLSSM